MERTYEINKEKFRHVFEDYCDAFKNGTHVGLFEVAAERVDMFGSPTVSYVDGYKDGWNDCMEEFRDLADLIFAVSVGLAEFRPSKDDVIIEQIRKSNMTAESQ